MRSKQEVKDVIAAPKALRKEKAQGNGDAILSEAPPSARSKD